MKLLVLLAFVAILGSLGAALYFMMRGGTGPTGPDGSATPKKRNPMAKALALRVGLSIVLFLAVLFSWWMGWIQPSGLPTR